MLALHAVSIRGAAISRVFRAFIKGPCEQSDQWKEKSKNGWEGESNVLPAGGIEHPSRSGSASAPHSGWRCVRLHPGEIGRASCREVVQAWVVYAEERVE